MDVTAEVQRKASRSLVVAIVLAVVVGGAFVVFAVKVATHTNDTIGQTGPSVQLIAGKAGHLTTPGTAILDRLGGGGRIHVGAATGHPEVVNFFASWCTACQKELGAVATVAHDGPVPIVGVDLDTGSGQAAAVRLLRKAHASYTVAIGTPALAERYGAPGLPTTAFLNGKGQIVGIAIGAVTRPDLLRWESNLRAGRPLGAASGSPG